VALFSPTLGARARSSGVKRASRLHSGMTPKNTLGYSQTLTFSVSGLSSPVEREAIGELEDLFASGVRRFGIGGQLCSTVPYIQTRGKRGLVRRENNDAPICAGFDGRLDAGSLGDLDSYLVHVWSRPYDYGCTSGWSGLTISHRKRNARIDKSRRHAR
jgi:hypothetical protein